jgi:hypothetical protein
MNLILNSKSARNKISIAFSGAKYILFSYYEFGLALPNLHINLRKNDERKTNFLEQNSTRILYVVSDTVEHVVA